MNIEEFRNQYPQYEDMSDKQIADSLHGQYYSDIPKTEFYQKLGIIAESKDKSAPDSFATRMGRGALQPVVTAAQAMSRPLAMLGEATGSEYLQRTSESADWMAEKLRREAEAGAPEGIDWGQVAGQTLATLPLGGLKIAQGAKMLPQMLNYGAQGAATGAALSGSTEAPIGQDIGYATAASMAVPAAFKGVASVLKPSILSEGSELVKRGVQLTPGQSLGGAAKRAEEAAASVPFLGDIVRSAQRGSFEDFNRAAFDETLSSLKAVGARSKLPEGLAGREAVGFMEDTISKAYDDVLSNTRLVADPPFISEVLTVKQMARELEPEYAKKINYVIDKKILPNFTSSGRMAGEKYKRIDSYLNDAIKRLGRSNDSFDLEVANAYRELKSMLRQLVDRSSPDQAAKLAAVDEAYAKSIRVKNAAGRVTSEGGVFTPEALASAVRKGDTRKHTAGYARGDALMQDFAEQARAIMGSRVPDSGTPLRAMVGMGLGGAGAYMNPLAALPFVPYLPGGREISAGLLRSRPDYVQALSQPISRAGGLLAPAGAPLALGYE